MAFNYPDKLRIEENNFNVNYISPNPYSQAESILNGFGTLGFTVYYRDLEWNGSQIVEASTGTQVASMSAQKWFLYYPQLLQLYTRCLEFNYYP
jgi:hypothetical protein